MSQFPNPSLHRTTDSRTTPARRGRLPEPRASGDGTGEETLTEQLLRIITRRKWIIVQALIVVVLATIAYTMQQEKEYTASASLLFQDTLRGDAATFTPTDPTREAATNGALVRLPAVAEYAARSTDGISAGEIAGSVSVETGASDSDIATIDAVSSSPERAAMIANAYAVGYIEFRRETERAVLDSSVEQLQANLDALPADRRDGAEGDELRRRITSLQAERALRTGGAELVQRASPPSAPSAPDMKRNVALAVVVGLVFGLLLAALVDRLDTRVRTVEDLERIYGLPVLAEVPRSRQLHDGRLRTDSDEPAAEPFRMLRTNLRYLSISSRLRSVMIVSPVRGDGKSTIARALAMTMATMGDSVVLVDADLHCVRPRLDTHGLSTVLVNGGLDEALITEQVSARNGDVRALTVLPAGPSAPNPSELLESEPMQSLLRELEQRFDRVIIDGPATTSVGDALSLIPSVSGVLIIGGLGRTTTKAAAVMQQQLTLLGGRPIGIVANFAPAPPDGYGYRR